MQSVYLSHTLSSGECECCGSQSYHTVVAEINGEEAFELDFDSHFGGNWHEETGVLHLLCLEHLGYSFTYNMFLKGENEVYTQVSSLHSEDPDYHFEHSFYFGEDNYYQVPQKDKKYTMIHVDLFYEQFSFEGALDNKFYELLMRAKITIPDSNPIEIDLSTYNSYDPIFEYALKQVATMSEDTQVIS